MFAGELRRQKALFAACDALALVGAFAIAVELHDPSGALEARLMRGGWLAASFGVAALVAVWLAVFRAWDLYRLRNGGRAELSALVKACTSAWLITLILGFFAHLDLPRLTLAIAYILGVPMAAVARAVCRALIRRIYSAPNVAIPLVVIGFNPLAHYVCDRIDEQLSQYEMIGFIDEGTPAREYRGYPVLGGVSQLKNLAAAYPGLEVTIAVPEGSASRHEELICACERLRLRWRVVPWMLRSLSSGLKVDLIGSVPVIAPRGSNIEGLNFAIKRAFDAIAAVVLLIATAPLSLAAAIAIWMFDGAPILFRQVRLGIHGLPFEMLKFRTMRAAADDRVHRDYVARWIHQNSAAQNGGDGETVFKITGDERITRVGRILRRLSLDELPQLWNVLRGDMSLVGPRPALLYELDHYEEWHRMRLEAPPGITGLWQTSGRNRLSFEDMVRLDVQYIQEWSLGADLRILARTVPAMFHGDGA
jgi:exopolysaccharide biosynthesis polyprenyl glycosylphosphotransferase